MKNTVTGRLALFLQKQKSVSIPFVQFSCPENILVVIISPFLQIKGRYK